MKLTFDKKLPEDFSLEKVYGVIYLILNLIDAKVYIGQSTSFFKRYAYYRTCNCKKQKYLYNAIQKYGLENFTIEIIDCAQNLDVLNFLENFYIKTLKANDRRYGYNIREGGNGGGPTALETKIKIGISNTGKECTPEHRAKISIANVGVKKSKEHIEKVRKANIGKKRTKEHKFKLRLAKLSKPSNNRRKIICITTGEIFNSLEDASLKYNIPKSNICKCCRGKRKYAGKLQNGTKLVWKYL